jgi:hypothetical protein
MPISNSQLAAVLTFFLALTLPLALYFMPNGDYVFVLIIGYAFAGGAICFSLLT